jgi:hypothetical protein
MHGGSQGKVQAAEYRIRVRGRLDRRWTGFFPGLTIHPCQASDGAAETSLSGTVPDQAALRGILCRLWDLGLTLSGVERCPAGNGERSS